MRNLNVEIEDATYEAAKRSAAAAGMLLRKWVERAILFYSDPSIEETKAGEKIKLREPHYEPID